MAGMCNVRCSLRQMIRSRDCSLFGPIDTKQSPFFSSATQYLPCTHSAQQVFSSCRTRCCSRLPCGPSCTGWLYSLLVPIVNCIPGHWRHTAEGAPEGGLVGKEHDAASGSLDSMSACVFPMANVRPRCRMRGTYMNNVRSSRDGCAACRQTDRTSGAQAHGWERRPYYGTIHCQPENMPVVGKMLDVAENDRSRSGGHERGARDVPLGREHAMDQSSG